ncbi:MAG: hypothetical protein H6843_17035 [Rhodospirillaceae bacterium]|nr:hypothetical protein [Rhodospirillaceae bacterium]
MKAAALNPSLLARKGAAHPSGLTLLAGRSDRKDGSDAGAGGCAAHAVGVDSTEALGEHPHRGSGPVAKLTLRLDRERHLRLKLVGAHSRRSVQEILTSALDEYLDRVVPEAFNGRCACLAASLAGEEPTGCSFGREVLHDPDV